MVYVMHEEAAALWIVWRGSQPGISDPKEGAVDVDERFGRQDREEEAEFSSVEISDLICEWARRGRS